MFLKLIQQRPECPSTALCLAGCCEYKSQYRRLKWVFWQWVSGCPHFCWHIATRLVCFCGGQSTVTKTNPSVKINRHKKQAVTQTDVTFRIWLLRMHRDCSKRRSYVGHSSNMTVSTKQETNYFYPSALRMSVSWNSPTDSASRAPGNRLYNQFIYFLRKQQKCPLKYPGAERCY